MDCLTKEALSHFLHRRLPPDASAQALRHLETCLRCQYSAVLTAVDLSRKTQAPTGAQAAEQVESETEQWGLDFARPERHSVRPELPELVEGPQLYGSAPVPPRGTLIDRYLVLDFLGTGAMGVVCSAYDPKLDRRVALKLLREDRLQSELGPTARTRFVTEAQAMARISHPNVIPVYDARAEGEQAFFSMELVDGATLKHWLSAGPRSWREIREVFLQAGAGLAAAHAAGLVHRDFKPENVLVGRDGRTRVTDFGVVRVLAADAKQERPHPLPDEVERLVPTGPIELTRSNLLGTPAYMAPEQLEGVALDGRADQFSFCATLWEAWYGQLPFAGSSLVSMWASAQQGALRQPPPHVRIPARLHRALVRGLSVKPSDRFPSMRGLLEELARESPLRQPRWLVATAAVVLLGLGTASFQVLESRRTGRCHGAAERTSGVWAPAQREGLKEHLLRSGRSDVELQLELVDKVFSTYLGRWASLRTQACEATLVRGEQSERTMEAKYACLDERLRDATALGKLLQSAPDAALHAVEAAESLPPLEPCTFLAQLPKEAVRSVSRETQDAVAQLRAEILTARFGVAETLAKALEERPEVAASHALRAQVKYLRGVAESGLLKKDSALETLHGGALEAEAAGDDRTTAEVYVRMARLRIEQFKLADAAWWLRHAEVAMGRLAPAHDLTLTSAKELTHAMLALAQSSGPEALAHSRAAIDGLRRLVAQEPASSAAASELARALYETARAFEPEQAQANLEEALALTKNSLGPSHPNVGYISQALSNAFERSGDLPRAQAAADQALTIFREILGDEHPLTLGVRVDRARQAILLGHPQDALPPLEQAVAALKRLPQKSTEALPFALMNLGEAQRLLGHRAEATASLKDALARISGTGHGEDNPWRAAALVRVWEVAPPKPLGKKQLAQLESAIGTLDGAEEFVTAARARFVLAQWLPKTQERAVTLAREAKRLLDASADPEAALVKKPVEDWIRERTTLHSPRRR